MTNREISDSNEAMNAGADPDVIAADAEPVRDDPSGLGEDPPPEVYDEDFEVAGPLLLKVPGNGTIFVRTADDDWVPSDATLVRGELARQHPHLEPKMWSKKGHPLEAKALIEMWGQRCDRLIYDLTRQASRFTPSDDGGGELLIACGKRPYIKPEFSPEVDTWLRLLFGPLAEKGLDWLATATTLTQPSSLLYLFGPKSAGKGLLAAGLARLWGQSVTNYDDITGDWNSALKNCPIVFLDEKSKPRENGSASLRSLTGERQRALTEKYRPAATLIGAVRVIVAANNLDALRLNDVRTRDDEDAIAERVLMIKIPRSGVDGDRTKAGDYLESLGGDDFTKHWVSHTETTEPGALTRHLAWLIENREVKRGHRFAVHGDAGEWIRGQGLREGLAQDAMIAIIHALLNDRTDLRSNRVTAWVKGKHALVNLTGLHSNWTGLTLKRDPPKEPDLAEALGGISVKRGRAYPAPGAPQVRVYHVPGEQLVHVAEALGIGDPDRLRELFDLPVQLHIQQASNREAEDIEERVG